MKMNFRAVRQFLSMGLLAGVAMACGLGLGSAARSADIAGSGDHPLVGRYDGAEIVGYRVTEFDETAIVEGAFAPEHATDRTGNGFRTIEGKIFLIYYKLPQGRSTLEVLRNYQDSLKAKGFTIVFACATADGTCFESRQPDAAYFLGNAIGDPLALPKLDDDYVHNWFEQQRRRRAGGRDQGDGNEQDCLPQCFADGPGDHRRWQGRPLWHPIRLRQGRCKAGIEADPRRDRQAAEGEARAQAQDCRSHRQ